MQRRRALGPTAPNGRSKNRGGGGVRRAGVRRGVQGGAGRQGRLLNIAAAEQGEGRASCLGSIRRRRPSARGARSSPITGRLWGPDRAPAALVWICLFTKPVRAPPETSSPSQDREKIASRVRIFSWSCGLLPTPRPPPLEPTPAAPTAPAETAPAPAPRPGLDRGDRELRRRPRRGPAARGSQGPPVTGDFDSERSPPPRRPAPPSTAVLQSSGGLG